MTTRAPAFDRINLVSPKPNAPPAVEKTGALNHILPGTASAVPPGRTVFGCRPGKQPSGE